MGWTDVFNIGEVVNDIFVTLSDKIITFIWEDGVRDFVMNMSPVAVVFGLSQNLQEKDGALELVTNFKDPVKTINSMLQGTNGNNPLDLIFGSGGQKDAMVSIIYVIQNFCQLLALWFLAFAILYIGASIGNRFLLKHTYTDSLQNLVNSILAVLLMGFVPTIVNFMLQINGAILVGIAELMTKIKVTPKTNLFEYAAAGPTQALVDLVRDQELSFLNPIFLLGLLLIFLTIGMGLYFLFYYFIRRIVFVVLMGISPIQMILYIFPKTRGNTILWFKDMAGLIFIQSIHAMTIFICYGMQFAAIGEISEGTKLGLSGLMYCIAVPIIMYLCILPVSRAVAGQLGISTNMLDNIHGSVNNSVTAAAAIIGTAALTAATGIGGAALATAGGKGEAGGPDTGVMNPANGEPFDTADLTPYDEMTSEADWRAKTMKMGSSMGRFAGTVGAGMLGMGFTGGSAYGGIIGASYGDQVGEKVGNMMGYGAYETGSKLYNALRKEDEDGPNPIDDGQLDDMADKLTPETPPQDLDPDGLNAVSAHTRDDKINDMKKSIGEATYATTSDIHNSAEKALEGYQTGDEIDTLTREQMRQEHPEWTDKELNEAVSQKMSDPGYISKKASMVAFDTNAYKASEKQAFAAKMRETDPNISDEIIQKEWELEQQSPAFLQKMNGQINKTSAAFKDTGIIEKANEQADAVTTNQMTEVNQKQMVAARQNGMQNYTKNVRMQLEKDTGHAQGSEAFEKEWNEISNSDTFKTELESAGEMAVQNAYKNTKGRQHVDLKARISQRGRTAYDNSMVNVSSASEFVKNQLDASDAKFITEDAKESLSNAVGSTQGADLIKKDISGRMMGIDSTVQRQLYSQRVANNAMRNNPDLAEGISGIRGAMRNVGAKIRNRSTVNQQMRETELADPNKLLEAERSADLSFAGLAGFAGSYKGVEAAMSARQNKIMRNMRNNPYKMQHNRNALEVGQIDQIVEKQVDSQGVTSIPSGSLVVRTTSQKQEVVAKLANGGQRVVSTVCAGNPHLQKGQVVYTDLDIKDGMIVPKNAQGNRAVSYVRDSSGGKKRFEGTVPSNMGRFFPTSGHTGYSGPTNRISEMYGKADIYTDATPISVAKAKEHFEDIRFEGSRAESIITGVNKSTQQRQILTRSYSGMTNIPNNVHVSQPLKIENLKLRPNAPAVDLGKKRANEVASSVMNDYISSSMMDTMLDEMMPFTEMNDRNFRANHKLQFSVRTLVR